MNGLSLTNEKLINAKEVAEYFFENKIPYKRVLELTNTGVLPSIKIGKRYYYLPSALEDWQNRNGSTPAWQKIK